jgi:two-component system, OmpR family, sensor kinase
MKSLGSYTRSAARATFSAYRTLPIRWRLAGGSAALTLVILAGFAAIVGALTARQVRGQFNDEVRSASEQLRNQLNGKLRYVNGLLVGCNRSVRLIDFASAEHAQIRVFDQGGVLTCTQDEVKIKGTKTPFATSRLKEVPPGPGTFTEEGYRVDARVIDVEPIGSATVVYARPLSDVDHTLARVQFFLVLGVLGGTFLALLAGLATAQRATRPIAELTEAAREIERTRDPSLHLPHPEASDEIAELASTLEGMLGALDASRGETEAMLDRQREFVADASHELRTPLTSVLANLELLTEELDGEQAETAEAALRSTRRMRRLVGDLLLLARADAKRVTPHRPTDLAAVVTDAAAELEPVAEDHMLTVDVHRALVAGAADDLHRLVLNLIENSLRHTPAGTRVRASTFIDADDAVLVVEDDGPGIPPQLGGRVFERFVRGGGDGGRGSGLGLAIVRAVAESHAGSVALASPSVGSGTRFVIRIPLAQAPQAPHATDAVGAAGAAPVAAQTSTTTGSTIGRRRKRS